MTTPRRRARPPADGDAGMVTAEIAIGIPAVLLTLILGLGTARTALDQIRCLDAARAGARAAARGDSDTAITAITRQGAPDTATIQLSRTAGFVHVDVTAPPPGPWPLTQLPPLHARATAADETTPTP
ncbi:hypothetical protein KEM60_01085 [Austwickia sp. TVS 96-490-7B]|uniref:TadE family type IV pilus minor pilin n=1 Tax=Austwickia sp. TVS 96-490-7B TaxID=2830843 RepID=UPI001C58EEC3|nr:TadE family type IV pilus minor pilin [Austwickia sp. TVS 96-490-7B]MBW3084895.1 hypothetical protein [Austwickia sp. TVS 96-490-7B]